MLRLVVVALIATTAILAITSGRMPFTEYRKAYPQSREPDGGRVKEVASNISVHTQPREDGDYHLKEDEGLHNITSDGLHNITGDGLHNITTVPRSKQKYSNLEILEAGLAEARAAIRYAEIGQEAPHEDFVPDGPMYLNATAFRRSYLEMEKRFKVYIYEDWDPPVVHYGPCKHTYAIEGLFIQALEVSPFRTTDASKAHLYFLPFSVTMITQFVYIPESHEWNLMKSFVADYVNTISSKYPYWNRTLGADHFMLACHDWGPELSFEVPYLYTKSIRALCNANTSERFEPSRDVSIPEILLPQGTTKGMIGGPSPSKRSILVFYAGGNHGPVRPILHEYWENKDPDVQVHQYLPKGVSYYGMMRKSKYCLCPSGYEVASPRTVEALYMGCVPVLIKEGFVIPFSDVLDWKTFAVVIPVQDIPNLKKILMAIPSRQYIKMQRRGIQVRRHFEINTPPKPYDVFHMILHSIWLRRLNFRVEDAGES